ncbi:hypothetical protein LC653_41540 [Nostoc sp. CHAB 5784]|uniref:ribbon-helix-helix domain-containing protein n=1 Tax=Nostoc mirabile TaxID=2907820 RepID=UPI001E4A7BDB|nr:hypothetical protein [Nostoc mirabile]MCC5670109.1 hypothetical protein [Nostoc mirabile CHAB5784]
MASTKLPVTLNDELYQQLQSLASANGLSMAAQIRYLIAQATQGKLQRFNNQPE